jgi:sugar lactone lactonase YvrE
MKRLLALALLISTAGQLRAQSDPYALMQQGVEARKSGDFKTAYEKFEQVTKILPQHPQPWIGTARALVSLGREKEAAAPLLKALRLGAKVDAELLAGVPSCTECAALNKANARVISRSTVAFTIPERALIPESIAHDPADGSFYVGSAYKQKIVRIAADGAVSDFVPSRKDGLVQVLGIKIDAERRELWANACGLGDDPPAENFDPATKGRGAVFRFDLKSGKLIRRYEPPADVKEICFNDIVLVGSNAYMTAGPDGIFRIDRDKPVIERFTEPIGWINGITASADGKTIYLANHVHGITALDVATKKSVTLPTPEGATMGGIDGLYLYGDRFIGVQNAAGVPARVVSGKMNADRSAIASVEVLEVNHPLADVPTTGVIVGDSLYYIANSQLDSFDEKTKTIWPDSRLHPTYILKLAL